MATGTEHYTSNVLLAVNATACSSSFPPNTYNVKLPSISSMHNNHLDFNGCYNHFGFCVDFKPYSLNDTFATRSCKMLND